MFGKRLYICFSKHEDLRKDFEKGFGNNKHTQLPKLFSSLLDCARSMHGHAIAPGNDPAQHIARSKRNTDLICVWHEGIGPAVHN
jgi:hypothetical protein